MIFKKNEGRRLEPLLVFYFGRKVVINTLGCMLVDPKMSSVAVSSFLALWLDKMSPSTLSVLVREPKVQELARGLLIDMTKESRIDVDINEKTVKRFLASYMLNMRVDGEMSAPSFPRLKSTISQLHRLLQVNSCLVFGIF